MSSPYGLYGTNTQAEKEGVVLDFGDFSITIARAGGANHAYSQAIQAKLKPHARRMQAGTMDEDLAGRLVIEAYAETVVKGWDNVLDRENNPLAFSRENCIRLFTDLPDLFAEVQQQANAVSNFRQQQIQDDMGNSQPA